AFDAEDEPRRVFAGALLVLVEVAEARIDGGRVHVFGLPRESTHGVRDHWHCDRRARHPVEELLVDQGFFFHRFFSASSACSAADVLVHMGYSSKPRRERTPATER